MSCLKTSHPTLNVAETAASKLSEERGIFLRAYCCDDCELYHITSKRKWQDAADYIPKIHIERESF